MDIIKTIYEEVKHRCQQETNVYGIGSWTHHIKTVYEIAVAIHKRYDADLEIVSLATLLHDVASITDEALAEEHHIHGAMIARELLTELQYPADKIKQVEDAIYHHRGSVLFDKNTNEEVCVCDADALTHFYQIPSLLSLAYKEQQLSIDEGSQKIMAKLHRSYQKLSPLGKEYVKEQYEAAKKILEPTQFKKEQ